MTHHPLTLAKANAIVSEYHRHNRPVVGHRFSIAAYDGDQMVGVAIVGRPIARAEDQENDVEILRVCTVPGAPKNTCSYLYAACRRIWQTWGGKTIRTTTLESESGSSLRGAGFVPVKRLRPRSGWDTPSRRRKPGTVDGVAKVKWEGTLRTPEPPQGEAADPDPNADGPEGPGLREAKPGYEESGWLIELPTSTGPKWWTAETMTGRWESDSTLAVRFSRKQDAEAVIEALMLTGTKATEHLWADLDTVCPRCEGQKYDKGTCSLCNNTGWVNEVPRRAPADALREDHL